jgi:hypothetical protein
LPPDDARAYLALWLIREGLSPDLFDRQATAELIAAAAGVPRTLNERAGRAVRLAANERARRVTARHVREATVLLPGLWGEVIAGASPSVARPGFRLPAVPIGKIALSGGLAATVCAGLLVLRAGLVSRPPAATASAAVELAGPPPARTPAPARPAPVLVPDPGPEVASPILQVAMNAAPARGLVVFRSNVPLAEGTARLLAAMPRSGPASPAASLPAPANLAMPGMVATLAVVAGRDAPPPAPAAASTSVPPASGAMSAALAVPMPAAPVSAPPEFRPYANAASPAAPAPAPTQVVVASAAPASVAADHDVSLRAAQADVPLQAVAPHPLPAPPPAPAPASAGVVLAGSAVAAASPLPAGPVDRALAPGTSAMLGETRRSPAAPPALSGATERATTPLGLAPQPAIALVANTVPADPPNLPGVSAVLAAAAPTPTAAVLPSATPPPVPAALHLAGAIPTPDPAAREVAGSAPPPVSAPGMLLIVRGGETLGSLYRKVYQGVVPPPFEAVVAANPKQFRPGDVLTFPPPPGGWKKQHTAARAVP